MGRPVCKGIFVILLSLIKRRTIEFDIFYGSFFSVKFMMLSSVRKETESFAKLNKLRAKLAVFVPFV